MGAASEAGWGKIIKKVKFMDLFNHLAKQFNLDEFGLKSKIADRLANATDESKTTYISKLSKPFGTFPSASYPSKALPLPSRKVASGGKGQRSRARVGWVGSCFQVQGWGEIDLLRSLLLK